MSQQRYAILFAGDVTNWATVAGFINDMKDTIKTASNRDVDIFCSCGADKESYDSFVAAMNPVEPAYIDYSELPTTVPGYPTPGPNDFSPALLGMVYHRQNVYNVMEKYGLDNNIAYLNSVYWMTENAVTPAFTTVWPVPLNNVFIANSTHDLDGVSYTDAYGECGAMKTYSLLFNHFNEYSAMGKTDTVQNFLNSYLDTYGVRVIRY